MTFPWVGISSAAVARPLLQGHESRAHHLHSLVHLSRVGWPVKAVVPLVAAAALVAAFPVLVAGGCSSAPFGHQFPSSSWQTEGGDFCRTGSGEAEAHPPLFLKWTANAGLAPVGPLAILEDAVAGSFLRRTVVLYSLHSGEALWKRNLRYDPSCGPSVSGGMLFVSTNIPDGKTYCLGLRDGKALWSTETGEAAGSPSAVPGSVLLCTRSGLLVRLATADGAVQWTKRVAQLAECSPGLHGETGVATTLGDTVVAFSTATGEPLWRYEAGGAQFGSPALCDGLCLFSTGDGVAICLNLEDGSELWRRELGGRCMSSPAVRDGMAYFTDLGGRLSCIVASTGEIVWEKSLDSPMRAGPAVSPLYIYTASLGGRVSCFARETGELLWSHGVDEPFETPAVITEMYVVVVSAKGKIYCFKEDLG